MTRLARSRTHEPSRTMLCSISESLISTSLPSDVNGHIDADERKIADVLLRFFPQPYALAALELGDAEHLGIGPLREQNLGLGLLGLEVTHELGDALVQQVVAEVHHEGLVADEVA